MTKDINKRLEELNIDIDNASEIFTTNAISGIISVDKVEDQFFSEFDIANKLQSRLIKLTLTN